MSIENIVKVAFKAALKEELQTTRNFLDGAFSKSPNNAYKKTQDFINRARTYNEINPTNHLDLTTSNRPTPPAQQLQYRRRVNNLTGDNIHADIPRYHAKLTQRELEAFGADIAKQVMHAKKRSHMNLTLQLLRTRSYKENIIIDDKPSSGGGVQVPLPVGQVLIPKLENSRRDLNLVNLISIESFLHNAMGTNIHGQGGIEGEMSSIRQLALFSVSGWRDFTIQNIDRFGDRDFFGKPVYIKGYGQFPVIQNFVVVTIPDEIFNIGRENWITGTPPANAPHYFTASDPTSGAAVKGGGWIASRLAGGTAPTGAVNLSTYHEVIFMARETFELHDPSQLNVSPINYRDKDLSFEKKLFCEWGLEGIRHYDPVFFRTFFQAS